MDTDPARLFDAMAGDYQRLESWYEHLYARLHALLTAHLAPARAGQRALDAGCGTGFQARVLRALGYETHGVDISAGLLAVARRTVAGVALARADLQVLPYAGATFDAIVCAGSTLSFVANPDRGLGELARVLRPGGRLLLECEHKWSLDLAWTLASALAGDPLGYGVSAGALWRALRGPLGAAIALPYPGYGTLTLFTAGDLRRRMAAAGLCWQRAWGIHAVTNIIPSTVLHRARLPRTLDAVYRALCRLDGAAGASRPGRALSNSLVVLATRGPCR
jgi:SAM-dependent methyltransferase